MARSGLLLSGVDVLYMFDKCLTLLAIVLDVF